MPFVKGISGNPKGIPKGHRQLVTLLDLRKACEEVGQRQDPKTKRKRGSIIEHYVTRAYRSDVVLCHLMNRLIPEKMLHTLDPDGGGAGIEIKVVFVKPVANGKQEDTITLDATEMHKALTDGR